MKDRCSIKARAVFSTVKLVRQAINTRQRVTILYRQFVEGPVVHNHPELTSLLLDTEDGGYHRLSWRLDKLLLLQVGDLGSDLCQFSRSKTIHTLERRLKIRQQRYDMLDASVRRQTNRRLKDVSILVLQRCKVTTQFIKSSITSVLSVEAVSVKLAASTEVTMTRYDSQPFLTRRIA